MDVSSGSIGKCACRAYFSFEDEVPKIGGTAGKLAAAAVKRKEFAGKAQTSLAIRDEGGASAVIGLGKKGEFRLDAIRAAAARAALFARESGFSSLGFAHDAKVAQACGGVKEYAEAVCEGALLSLYRFDKYKAKDDEKRELGEIVLENGGKSAGIEDGISYAKIVCRANSFARDIANESGDAATPESIARAVRKEAGRLGISFESLGRAQCAKLGMGAYLSVAAGCKNEPEFVVLRYKPKKAKGKVCLVGKGVTFDSGGISLKPGRDMDKMKHDKCGGAAVFGALAAAAMLKVGVEVIGIVPLVENMPSGGATKPGDIVKASNGKTIEVQNTDAEGRMILADALCYAQKFKPDAVIDLATLTGAVSVALGSQAAGLLGRQEWLNKRISDAGEKTHERVWELPLWEEYGEAMKGEFSDLKNISGDGEAGTITAAAFLSNFAGEGAPWAHIDIAGTSYSYRPKGYCIQAGANGFGVRLLAKMLSQWKAPPKKGK